MNRRSLSAESLVSSGASARRHDHPSSTITIVYDRWTVFCLFFATINILNGLWMVITPIHWYYNLPAGVPEYGPLNVHFIRDLGAVFFLLGIGLIIAAFYPVYRMPLFTANTAFYLAHMFVHVHEVVSGRVRPSMFWVDLPGVYVPAVIALVLNVFLITRFSNGEATKRIRK